MEAIQLLDYNCWEHVFQNLNAEDLLNCRLVCKPFNQILELKKFQSKWKFHAILPLIMDYLRLCEERPGGWISDWKHLCSVRLICRSWRHSLDKYTSDVYGSALTSTFRDPLETRFQAEEELEEFQERFGELESHTNPFPSKIVVVDFLRLHMPHVLPVALVVKIGNFFEQFGTNIFKLHLFLPFDEAEDRLTWFKLARRISIHLPNLKALAIGKASPDGPHNDYNDDYFRQINYQELATFIEENPLEDLPQLQELEVYGLDWKMEDYLLEKYASQLTHFDRNFQVELLPQIYGQEFKNLRKLSLEFLDGSNDTLEMLRLLKTPLKHLKLKHSNYGHHDHRLLTWNVDKALRNIKHLPVERLEIMLSSGYVAVIEAGLQLEEYMNESIHTLSIFLGRHRGFSFNFIQALTKLEKLELEYYPELEQSHPEILPEVVKLNDFLMVDGGTDYPYWSNVWEKVPSLTTLILTCKRRRRENGFFQGWRAKSTYTREKYERIRMN